MLKRSYEDGLVVVWAQSDQAKDVCEDALVVVWGAKPSLPLLCEVVLVAWTRPKAQERLDTGAVLAASRHDQ